MPAEGGKGLVKLYFDPGAPPARVRAIRRLVESDERVESTRFVSREEALETMKRRYPDLVEGLAENPLPASLEVTTATVADAESLARDLGRMPGVDHVKAARAP